MLTITFKSALTYTQILHAIYMMCRAHMASIQDCEAVLACTKVINDHGSHHLIFPMRMNGPFSLLRMLLLVSRMVIFSTSRRHVETPEQVDAGVVEPRVERRDP